MDNHTRESLAIRVGQRIRGIKVVEELERVALEHGWPQRIQVDNGPEFISKDLDLWAYWNRVKLDFSRPGKPTDNAFIESFNARFRLGQGLRFGLLVWLLWAVPIFLIDYATMPIPLGLTGAQIGLELIDMLILGLAAAGIYRE